MAFPIARRPLLVGSLAALVCATISPAFAVEEASWPHTITGQGGSATIYEPQAISWADLKTLTARTAVAITPAGSRTPIYGTIELTLATDVDVGTRSVTLTDPKLVSASFPDLDPARKAELETRIRAVMAEMGPKHVPLDTILLSLKEHPAAPQAAVNNDPPRIFFSNTPALLVVFDGPPVLAPIEGTTLSYAVNTNWDVFKDAAATWYLRDGASWLSAPDANGPFSAVRQLPAEFTKLPGNANFEAAHKAMPPKPFPGGMAPHVEASTVPAEIIVTKGPPQFVPVTGTGLQRVGNTESVLYFDPTGGRFYYLVSGRWFAAPGLDGPWTFATPDLPPDFAKLPPNLLASVPGTPQAQEAVLRAQLPHQGTLKRTATLHVVYGGAPRFAPIPGTTIEYAVNTHYQVLRIGGVYYCCYQGAWFRSSSPDGPWVLADSVPAAIYSIPPSSPAYPVTYVKVVSATPPAVTYAYTSGYALGFITAGVLVYGTGYYYPPVVVPGVVPAYYPYPYSYGGGAYYNSATGAWARGGAVYGPYGGAGAFSAYNPSTGSYARGSAAWSNGSGYANASWYNARTGVSGTTQQNANPYERWGSSTFSGPNQTVNTRSASNANGSAGAFHSSTGAEGAGVHTKSGNNAAVARGAGGNVYAGADGNVYKHTSNGWEKYNNGSWSQPQQPARDNRTASQAPAASPYSQLDQDRRARDTGYQQQRFGGREYGGREFGGRDFGGGGRDFGGGRFRR